MGAEDFGEFVFAVVPIARESIRSIVFLPGEPLTVPFDVTVHEEACVVSSHVNSCFGLDVVVSLFGKICFPHPSFGCCAICHNTSQRKLFCLQMETKDLQKAFELQEAITNIGVQRIIDSIEEQYVEELNEDYFGYANQTIKSLLEHLHTNWCKVMTKECTDATKAFYHAWIPSSTHVITFGCQLMKLQKKC
jgi:hypothetical protein